MSTRHVTTSHRMAATAPASNEPPPHHNAERWDTVHGTMMDTMRHDGHHTERRWTPGVAT
ncbi:hypothetical protein DXG01_006951 [Tephrocybe rancida]|nr:hypothetical protein DXG01_006951 [Tephrocybe rancida]